MPRSIIGCDGLVVNHRVDLPKIRKAKNATIATTRMSTKPPLCELKVRELENGMSGLPCKLTGCGAEVDLNMSPTVWPTDAKNMLSELRLVPSFAREPVAAGATGPSGFMYWSLKGS